MKKVEVSIIIPVYNVKKYIETCVNSILEQNFKEFEIILVDDGSNDGSSELCDHLSQLSDTIKVIHQKNQGVSSARNQGIYNAIGKYLCFIDADDQVYAEYLQTMYNLIETHKVDLVLLNWASQKINRQIEKKCNPVYLLPQQILDGIFDDNKYMGYVWNKMFSSKIILENHIYFNTEFKICEDLDFCINYIKSINKGIYLDTCLNVYNYRIDSVMNDYSYEKERSRLVVIENLINQEKHSSQFRVNLEKEYFSSHVRGAYWESFENHKFNKQLVVAHLDKVEQYKNNISISNKIQFAYWGIKYFPYLAIKIYNFYRHYIRL